MFGTTSFEQYKPDTLVKRNKGKKFTIIDCESNGTIYLKDQHGEQYVIDTDGKGLVTMTRFENAAEKLAKMETIIWALAEKLDICPDEVLEEAARCEFGVP